MNQHSYYLLSKDEVKLSKQDTVTSASRGLEIFAGGNGQGEGKS